MYSSYGERMGLAYEHVKPINASLNGPPFRSNISCHISMTNSCEYQLRNMKDPLLSEDYLMFYLVMFLTQN